MNRNPSFSTILKTNKIKIQLILIIVITLCVGWAGWVQRRTRAMLVGYCRLSGMHQKDDPETCHRNFDLPWRGWLPAPEVLFGYCDNIVRKEQKERKLNTI